MKKYLGLLPGSFLLAGCGMTDFSGSRTGNEGQFLMDYKVFNTTDSQVLKLEKGDQIYGKIEKKSGKLSVLIRKEGEDPIFESKGMPTGSFRLEIEEGGEYRITVKGKRARGSLSFTKE